MTLRELLERERDRAAKYYMTNGGTLAEQYHDPQDYESAAWGFNRALYLLMPVVQAAHDLQSVRADHLFSAYNSAQSVGSEQKLYAAIAELEAQLEQCKHGAGPTCYFCMKGE